MKKNFSKLLALYLPYLLLGLAATNFGEAWRLAEGKEMGDRILSLMSTIPAAFANPLPSLHPLDILVGICCGAGLRLAVYLKSKNAKKYRHPSKYFFGFFKNSSASHPVFLLLVRGHHAQKGGFTMRKRYNTPHRSRVVKTRMTEEEYAEFAERLSAYNMSQAEFIRQAITGAAIRPIITVSPVNDELLAAVGKLTAEYGRIGGNLNQIARTLNEWHSPYPQLAGEVRAAVSDLAALKFEVLQKVGDAVGNIQTYQL